MGGAEKASVATALARAFLKDAPILLLDEATSALDTQTERDIQDSLKAMGQGRSVITIAHRLSTVVDADRNVFGIHRCILQEFTPAPRHGHRSAGSSFR
jgi:ATP-binding cassette subfamily B protein